MLYVFDMTYQLEYKRAGSGFYEVGLAGETLTAKSLVYLDASGHWRLADQSNATKMPCLGITLEAINSGKYGRILTQGYVGDSTWSFTAGAPLYASAVAGELTEVPTTSGQQQVVAHAKDSNLVYLFPWENRGGAEDVYLKYMSINVESLGLPNTNPPVVVDQDNLRLLRFTLNTDSVSVKLPKPVDYVSGALNFSVYWTNDGGVDDNGKTVKAQMSYQTTSEGDPVSGNHANSPKTVEDTYASASGWIEHHSSAMTIAAADFVDEECIFAKISFITPTGTALTCEPHLIGLCLSYLATPDR